jgi:hypothetical protein
MAWRRQPKYRAKKTECDGILFASKKEAQRYMDLKLLEKAGDIRRLELQPRYRIDIHGIHVCTYIADFRYHSNGKLIVEDVKGIRTPIYRLKKKLMRAIYGITIMET